MRIPKGLIDLYDKIENPEMSPRIITQKNLQESIKDKGKSYKEKDMHGFIGRTVEHDAKIGQGVRLSWSQTLIGKLLQ